jgi:manganese transport protein
MTHRNLLSARGWGQKEDDGKESHRSVAIPKSGSWVWKLLAFSGPGFMVAVGYMDPGNWATDLVGGSAFGYVLLSVILLSSLSAILLQYLSAKLGIATGQDLAEITRASVPKPIAFFLWVMAEIMIIACDLAEVIGTAVALLLLFHVPIVWGVCITALDVFLLLYLQHKGLRLLEALVICLIAIIGISLGIDVVMANPSLIGIFSGFVPTPALFHNTDMLYVAIGIIGATVMPHNLYLHSALSQTRRYEENEAGKREAIKYSGIDSGIALSFAFLINAAILIRYREGIRTAFATARCWVCVHTVCGCTSGRRAKLHAHWHYCRADNYGRVLEPAYGAVVAPHYYARACYYPSTSVCCLCWR